MGYALVGLVLGHTIGDHFDKVDHLYGTMLIRQSLNHNPDGVSSTSGFYLVEPGIPDSVWVIEQTDLTMGQLDSLTFTANIYDQFANLCLLYTSPSPRD